MVAIQNVCTSINFNGTFIMCNNQMFILSMFKHTPFILQKENFNLISNVVLYASVIGNFENLFRKENKLKLKTFMFNVFFKNNKNYFVVGKFGYYIIMYTYD